MLMTMKKEISEKDVMESKKHTLCHNLYMFYQVRYSLTTTLTPPTLILNRYSRLIHRFLIKILIYTTNKTY